MAGIRNYSRELSVDIEDDAGPSIVVRHRLRAERENELMPTSQGLLSHEALRRLRHIMARLQEIGPTRRTDIMLMTRAFLVWAEKFPLYQKCDELAKQLQERSETMTILKESYLRDVIRYVTIISFRLISCQHAPP